MRRERSICMPIASVDAGRFRRMIRSCGPHSLVSWELYHELLFVEKRWDEEVRVQVRDTGEGG